MGPDRTRACPACGGTRWSEFVRIGSGRIMSGDQRIVPGRLEKDICHGCGVAANARILSPEDIEQLYGEEYVLNTLGREEHHFFTKAGPVARSQVFFDWIAPHVPDTFQTLLEIGCGEGNVLNRFAQVWPDRAILGIEGSRQASDLARAKGLAVEQGLVGQRPLPRAEAIIAINVLEHVEDVGQFLSVIREALAEDGRVLFTLPVQDYPGYDLFFAEHVWHFTASQCQAVLARNGFATVFVDVAHPVNHGIGLFVCRKAPLAEVKPLPEPTAAIRNRDTWVGRFAAVNEWHASRPGKRIALFGASEVATLLLAFTTLGDRNPVACIDEDPSRLGSKKHGLDVVPPGWLAEGRADAVLLAVNPRYHAQIRDKLKGYAMEIFSFT